jgi:hypothetical protein
LEPQGDTNQNGRCIGLGPPPAHLYEQAIAERLKAGGKADP